MKGLRKRGISSCSSACCSCCSSYFASFLFLFFFSLPLLPFIRVLPLRLLVPLLLRLLLSPIPPLCLLSRLPLLPLLLRPLPSLIGVFFFFFLLLLLLSLYKRDLPRVMVRCCCFQQICLSVAVYGDIKSILTYHALRNGPSGPAIATPSINRINASAWTFFKAASCLLSLSHRNT